ncbi:MAG: aspartyl protease family protein [Bacteroidota bacterium]
MFCYLRKHIAAFILCFPLLLHAKAPQGFAIMHNLNEVKIPIDIQNNIILIPLRINGSFEMNFILDTGVKTTILTEPLVADFLQLDSLTRVRVRGLGEGDAIDAHLARDVSIALPGVTGSGINLLVLPKDLISYSGMFGRPVYGIIGYEIFNQFVVEINYQQQYIKLSNPFRFRPKTGKKWQSFPIEVHRSKPYIHAQLIDFRGEKVAAKWLLDTGASMAVSLFDTDLPLPAPHIETFLGQGLSGYVFGKLGRSQSFHLGPYAFESVITGYPDSTSLNHLPFHSDSVWYGNIGAEIISRFRIIFDYRNQRVYMKKNGDFRSSFDYNVSGIELLSVGTNFDRFVISYVRPASPAAEAGLRINDELVALNGSPVLGLEMDELYGTLSRREGRMVQMKIRRKGKLIKAKFRLQGEI